MRQETFAILFLMRKGRPKKNGLAPIFARITTGGLRQEVYTQCDSNPETWNQHKERAMGTNKLAIQVNERLNDFRVKIIDIRTKLLAEGYAANAAQIKQRYLNPTCNTMMLIAGLADYAKRRQGEVGVRITQRTADKYERLLRYLKQYLAQRGKAEDIPVERMNYEFLDGFNLFLQTAHRCRHNGAVAVMDCLRNFVLYCLRNEWITKNPFRYYKLKEDEVQAKEHLTAHELELLTRKKLDRRLARIRDVFVFCCLTGLAFADADHLRREHLSQDDEGRWWIHKPREKTSVMSRIPLLPASLEILRRYERDEACLARGRVQPEDERLHEGDRGRVRHRQGADHPLRPPHLRLHGRRIRDADRRAGQDSRPLEHQHDAPLRQVLRDGHRPRDGGLRRAAGVGGFGRVAGRRGLGRIDTGKRRLPRR